MSGYKINSSKSVAFLYSKDKQNENEIMEMTLLTIATNNLGVTLIKQVKDPYLYFLRSLREDLAW